MKEKRRQYKTNKEIKHPVVRLVGDGQSKILNTSEALKMAYEQNKDLILINESQNPPIVKIEEYNKFLYNIEKIEKEKRRKTKISQVKQINLSTNIAENDINTKVKKAQEFLSKGNKVKVVLEMRGREKLTPEKGETVLLKYALMLEEDGVLESLPKCDNNKWSVVIRPKK